MRILKIIAISLICFIIFIVSAVTIFINLFDLNSYKDNITQSINKEIEGRIELGEISSFWLDGLQVSINKFYLYSNIDEKPVISNDSASLEISWLSIFKFQPKLILVLHGASIHVLKLKDGSFNFSQLLKMKASSSENVNEKIAKDTPGIFYPNLSKLSLRIENGNLSYTDLSTGKNLLMKNFNINLDNTSLDEGILLEGVFPISGTAEDLNFEGSIKVRGTTLISAPKKKASPSINMALTIDATDLWLKYGKGTFSKNIGTAAYCDIKMESVGDTLSIKETNLRLGTTQWSMNGTVIGKDATNRLNLQLSAKDVDLKELEEFFAFSSFYKLAGKFNLSMRIQGDTKAPQFNGRVNIKDGELSYEEFFKEKLRFDLKSSFYKNKINIKSLLFSSLDSNLLVQGDIYRGDKASMDLTFSSKFINLDKILRKDIKAASLMEKNWNVFIPRAEAIIKGITISSMFSKNAYLKKMKGAFRFSLQEVVYDTLLLKKLQASSHFKFPYFYFDQISFSGLGGSWKLNSRLDLSDDVLPYRSSGIARGLNIDSFTSYYFPFMKGAAEGRSNIKWNVSGVGFPKKSRRNSLNGYASFSIQNGAFRKINFSNILNSLFRQNKFNQNGTPLSTLKLDEGFRSLSAKANFKQSKIYLKNIQVIGRKRGFNVKGRSVIAKNWLQDTYLELYDPNGLLPSEIAGKAENPLALHLVGSLTTPKLNYSHTITQMAKRKIKGSVKKIEKRAKKKIGNILKNIGISE